MHAVREPLTVVLLVVYLFFPVLVACFTVNDGLVQDPDVWWHLRTADWIWANSAVPRFDPFAAAGGSGQSAVDGPGKSSRQEASRRCKQRNRLRGKRRALGGL